ncbi:class I SAM-dependent methyltransferase [Glycomyces terrestris]|uniref:Class I SAM-dependent methyltransferase n=1 Tax=Glycomyces terrestris TaxID=2493553 RepID=A0A426USJ7_9ACTN|nr:class I SAM-dependent methyltransferase [Glycomyces terrestris]RRR96463.1 class I SAM-dependent methyltransferase [Glycomyces terrestris]
MTPRIRTIAIGAAAAAAAAAGGYALGGPALAAYALLSTSLCGAAAVLWRQARRAEARQTRRDADLARLAEQVASLSQGLDRQHRSHEKSLRRLGERVGALGERIDLVPGETRRLALEGDRTAEIAAVLDDVRDGVASFPAKTRRLVREWNRMVYAEIEDLTALYRDIEPDRALPPLHGWAAGPDLARYLYRRVVEDGRTRVLECGSGSTTVVLAYALKSVGRGHVHALEHDPRFAEATRAMLKERGLDQWATVLDAPLTDVEVEGAPWRWYDPAVLPAAPIDLLLVDGPPGTTGPQARYPALPVLVDRLAEDAVVVLDDTRRDDEHRIGERWAERFEGWSLRSLPHDHGTIVLSREPKPEF